jgi:predicted membrane protein
MCGLVSELLITYAVTNDKIGRAASLMFILVVFGYTTDIFMFGKQLVIVEVIMIGIMVICSGIIFGIKCRIFKEE